MKALTLLMLLIPLALAAQEDAPAGPAAGPCDAPEYRQFDFWIGDWNVTAGEQVAGTNSIHTVHGGCALQENWQGAGAGGISGSSFNIYDQATGKWHQTWVDASGTLLQLDGGLVDGSMVLSGTRPAQNGGTALHRISWTPNADGSVRQLWEASQDEGGSWSVLFDGLYVKSDARP
ncbi:MAG: hypothetical protein OQK01_15770 [Xanthomonadales bacterium]|jgi:hypothetical protein|nr:hypothetical protein [Xanthomonadales bacterium]